ncbi:binding-protein-dependent permease [Alsobacter metallidurans]|uniref:Binding-protein-dependent permease n=1 Tax=Alsobacter metallidurans TaxID=340221 RepID=A0A917MJP9_9HYPH|nr:ABC transporter permease [Alsobacter metallidurans]GGH19141.1 binding-protein-dependent permease [Alsobacter metallidurans]
MNTVPGVMKRFAASELFHSFRHNRSAMIGAAIVAMFVVMVSIGPWLVAQDPYDVAQLELMDSFKPPVWLEGGVPQYLLGTDGQGRDVLASIVYGSRISLFIGFTAMLGSCVLGAALGLLAGFYGGKLDSVIMRIADIQLSFPSVLTALFLMSAFGTGADKVLIALISVGWVVYARIVRGSTLRESQKEYVQAARVSGLPNRKIILRHVLPNVLTPLIVVATIQVGTFILIEASLSFLGVGVPITEPSLGLLIKNGFDVLFSGLWWISVFPGLFIMLIVFGINLLGDFLRDELNPRLK